MKTYIAMSLVAVMTAGCVPENPRQIIRSAGYLTTVPPSTSFGPGNIVRKKRNRYIGAEDVSLKYICSPASLKIPAPPEKGTGEISSIGGGREFSFNGESLKTLGLDFSAKYVRNLTIKFNNVEYLEYADESQSEITSNIGRGTRCFTSLRRYRGERNAYIVGSTFKADLDYSISYNAPVKGSIKTEIVKEIGAEFGISVDKDQATVGRGLYYGVTLDPLF